MGAERNLLRALDDRHPASGPEAATSSSRPAVPKVRMGVYCRGNTG